MSQNIFLETGSSDEDATVYVLESDAAIAIAKYIQTQFPSNQTAAAKHLRIGQNEVSALLSGNLIRFSLQKLIRIARRAHLRLYLDMGDTSESASVSSVNTAPGSTGIVANTLVPDDTIYMERAYVRFNAQGTNKQTVKN